MNNKYLDALNRYRTVYKNWFSVLMHMTLIGNRNIIKAKLRNGNVKLMNAKTISYTSLGFTNVICDESDKSVKFEYRGKTLKFFTENNNGALDWVFSKESYNELNVRDKVVIDIGANIGDSSIYFALNGAKKVIAFEPFLNSFDLLVKNIDVNDLKDKIIPVNAGVGGNRTIVKIESNKDGDASSEIRVDRTGDIELQIFDLQTLLETFNINEAIMKINCEGCEYDTFLNASCESLRKFEFVHIEYHYGKDNLLQKLEKCGFKFSSTTPKKVIDKQRQNPVMNLGYIYAARNDNLDYHLSNK